MARADQAAKIDELFDFIVANPEGVTIDEIADELEITTRVAQSYIRALRLIFADDVQTVIAQTNGSRSRWLYRFVGDPEEAKEWFANQLRHLEARLETERSAAQSLVNATDGRTVDGRRARIIARALSRLEEDLADLKALV